jgi:hypothetical protein
MFYSLCSFISLTVSLRIIGLSERPEVSLIFTFFVDGIDTLSDMMWVNDIT